LQPISQQTRVGDNVTIKCEIDSASPYRVHWSKTNSGSTTIISLSSETSVQTVQNYLARMHIVQVNDTLMFNQVRQEDEGSFLCTVVNSGGKAEAVAELMVRPRSTDELTESSEILRIASIGQNVRLVCPAKVTSKNLI
jgi:hypothetical protein